METVVEGLSTPSTGCQSIQVKKHTKGVLCIRFACWPCWGCWALCHEFEKILLTVWYCARGIWCRQFACLHALAQAVQASAKVGTALVHAMAHALSCDVVLE